MKRILVCTALLVLSLTGIAQSSVTTVEHQKVTREAIMNDIPFSENVIAEAIKDTLQKLGYKGKDSKGFTVYRDVKLPALGSDAYDLYFSVDKKSKKEKEVSRVTMMVSKGADNFITEKTDPGLVHNAKTFLNHLHHTVASYHHSQKLAEQEEVVSKIEKKIITLGEEADDLQKKKKKLEKEIEDNSKEQADQQKELEKQRQVLSTLKGING